MIQCDTVLVQCKKTEPTEDDITSNFSETADINIIGIMKTSRLSWVRHLAQIEFNRQPAIL